MWFSLSVLLAIAVSLADAAPLLLKSKPHHSSYDNYISEMPYFSGRISEQKCKEYVRQIMTRNIRKRRLITLNEKPSRISEYPHMGALGWILRNHSWIFLCGSSLISPNFVLTAAHCKELPENRMDVLSNKPVTVRLGTSNVQETDIEIEQPITTNIKQLIPHPKYQSPVKYYDIMLVELEKPVQFTIFVQPACLSSHLTVDISKQYTVSGWGATKGGYLSPVLLSTKLNVFENQKCDSLLRTLKNRNWNLTNDQQICAGKLDGSSDTCKGDSGDPLQMSMIDTKYVKMHTVVAVTSFGIECRRTGKPGVYTKVSYFLDWIEEQVWPENVLTDSLKYKTSKVSDAI